MRSTVRSASRPLPSPVTEPPRSLTTTFAPCFASSSAWPRPIPWPAPVTIATLPSNKPMVHSYDLTGRQIVGSGQRGGPTRGPTPRSVMRDGGLHPVLASQNGGWVGVGSGLGLLDPLRDGLRTLGLVAPGGHLPHHRAHGRAEQRGDDEQPQLGERRAALEH